MSKSVVLIRMKTTSKSGWTLPETWQDPSQKKRFQTQFGTEGIQMLTLRYFSSESRQINKGF